MLCGSLVTNTYVLDLQINTLEILLPEKIVTARKRSLGQGYIFTGVCHSVNKGGSASVHAGIHPLPRRPPPRRPSCQGDPHPLLPSQGDPLQGDPPPRRPPSRLQGDPPRPTPRGKLRGIRSRPTPKGKIQGDQIQANTQGENSGGSDPDPHPRGKFRGIRTRPTPPTPHDDYCCGRYASYWNALLCLGYC